MAISESDLIHLRRAVAHAREAADSGDGPFGSVLVDAAGVERFADRNREASTGDDDAASGVRDRPLGGGSPLA